MNRDDFFQQAMLKMAEVILLRTDKEPTPEQLAQKAKAYAVALHDSMLAGLTALDIVEATASAPATPRGAPQGVPTLFPARTKPAQDDEEGPSCPTCGGPTRRRNGQFGPFWGCAAYPRCKGIAK